MKTLTINQTHDCQNTLNNHKNKYIDKLKDLFKEDLRTIFNKSFKIFIDRNTTIPQGKLRIVSSDGSIIILVDTVGKDCCKLESLNLVYDHTLCRFASKVDTLNATISELGRTYKAKLLEINNIKYVTNEAIYSPLDVTAISLEEFNKLVTSIQLKFVDCGHYDNLLVEYFQHNHDFFGDVRDVESFYNNTISNTILYIKHALNGKEVSVSERSECLELIKFGLNGGELIDCLVQFSK